MYANPKRFLYLTAGNNRILLINISRFFNQVFDRSNRYLVPIIATRLALATPANQSRTQASERAIIVTADISYPSTHQQTYVDMKKTS